VSPEEEPELRGIERAIGRKLPRIIVPDFDYAARPETKLEIPLAERIAQIRAKKAEDRERSRAKAARREANGLGGRPGSGGRSGGGRPGGRGGAGGRPAARGGR
jgi:ATP-dependent RNA helicase RhlE